MSAWDDVDAWKKRRLEAARDLAEGARQVARNMKEISDAEKARRKQRPATDDERQAARALSRATFPVASFDKRFARDMHTRADMEGATYSEAQVETLKRKIYRYRRQIRAEDLPESWRWLLHSERRPS